MRASVTKICMSRHHAAGGMGLGAGFARSEGGLVMTPRSFTSSGMPCTSSSLYQTYKSAVSEGLMEEEVSKEKREAAQAVRQLNSFEDEIKAVQKSLRTSQIDIHS
eukprot:gene26678-4253_t